MRVTKIIVPVTFLLFFSPHVLADAGPVTVAQRITTRVQVDGILNEPFWQADPAIQNLVQVEPNPGRQPTEVTQLWVAYSSHALYVAVRCEDRQPARIVATEMRRDAQLGENDHIAIVLDTYHDHRNAYFFATNPAGALVDGRVTENQEASLEWDGIWLARTLIDERGWTAEFEIPFKTIGFSPAVREWGFNVSRYLARGRETSRWASPSLDVELNQMVRAGNLSGLNELSQGVGLDVKPYGIVGFTRDIDRLDPVEADGNAGADVFYRITSNFISSTTFNTDFAETEVDTRQVNLTRFPLFFPEKRGFFLEDAGIFEFAKAGDGPPGQQEGGDLLPFFSRRIGLVQGNEVPLRVGEKMTGKIGRFDIGLLDVQTGALTRDERVLVPGKNLAVGRVKANFLSQSYVGALFTNGDPTGLTSNQVGGIDMKVATSNFLESQKNLSVMLFGTKSRTTGIEGRDSSYGGVVSYPNDLVSAQYKWMKIGENYNPALGFVPRPGVRISALEAELSPRPKFWNIRQMSFELEYSDYYSLSEGSTESRELTFTPLQWAFNSGEWLNFEYERVMERLYEPWEIADGVILPVGKYDFSSLGADFNTSETRPFFVSLGFRSGSFFGGTRREARIESTWRKDRHLSTALSLEQNWVRLEEGNFNTSLVMYRLDYSFTPFITLATFTQYDTESRNLGLQSRLRWILKPGNEFFLVLNHAWEENQFDRFEAAQTRFRVKFNYTFRF
ncbi:MAG: hypothetical protein EHM18_08995 [Acidobacteria bacterium]|nr:MAG: hypothetical protein EHM18_08995 [Acidobacteriota bacterium]